MDTSPIIDLFIPSPDIRKRHSIIVPAPQELVYKVACNFDLQSVALVHFIFWLREVVMRSSTSAPVEKPGITPRTLLERGWGKLAEKEGAYLIAGAGCQPWQADVVFTPIPAEQFEAYAEPDQVKIVWTIETKPLGSQKTELSTETWAVATDEQAHRTFRRYWRWMHFGIIAIRWLLLPAIRKEVLRQAKLKVVQ